jgi:hypothetical protein
MISNPVGEGRHWVRSDSVKVEGSYRNDFFSSLEEWETGKTDSLHTRWRLNAAVPGCVEKWQWSSRE